MKSPGLSLFLSLLFVWCNIGQAEPTTEEVAKGIGDLFQQFWQQRPPAPTSNQVGSRQERAVFLKTHGCARATFTVPKLRSQYRIGLFKTPATRDAWVRISSDTIPRSPDQKNNTIGFAVKVLGVEGRKILPGEETFTTHDFLLQNHHVFFVDQALDFLEFTRDSLSGKFDEYAAAHPRTKQILDDMEKPVANVLASNFWSTLPSQFGEGHYVKYKVVPCRERAAEPIPGAGSLNYLQERLERDLRTDGACFLLQVQRRDETRNTKADTLNPEPLDRATKEWEERFAKPVTVAVIEIPPQDIKANAAQCEKMSFTAWHALPEHRPVGSISEARGIVYKRMADLRRANTGALIQEP